MNWTRIVLAGLAGGIAGNISDWILHGMILSTAYMKYPVFTQEQANPLHFLLVSVCMAIAAAILFAKTRSSWAAGLKGGATFGFMVGLVFFFSPFYSSLTLEGYPYHLSWCQGGSYLISLTIMGLGIGAVYK